MDAREDGALFARAVVERELEQLLGLRHGLARQHLYSTEVRLAERVKVHFVLKQRLYDHVGEVDGGCGGSLGARGRRSGSLAAPLPARRGFVAHMRKEQHIADGRRVGQEHHQTVDAHAHAARRRHAVLERAHVVLVIAHGLVVAHILGRNLRAEALGLVHRVVQLAEGVGVLVPANEQLEALGEVRVASLLLGQRRHLQRVVDHERGMDELLLGHRLEDLGDELALAPGAVGMSTVLLQNGNQLLARAREAHVLARALARQLDHRPARPLARQVHVLALVGDLQRAACGHRRRLDVALRELHHAFKVGKRLIGLHRGELGVVVGVHALVAELAADLEHLLEPAHKQALERQLRGDAQVVVAIERIEVRDEGLGVRTA